MKWRGRRGSGNVVDRRRMGATGGGLSIVGVLLVLGVGYFFGIDVRPVLEATGVGMNEGQPGEVQLTEQDQQIGQFVSVVLADTEEVWTDVLASQENVRYQPPQLVLFSGSTQSQCGGASAATGPFYCPLDQKAYLDTDFFQIMERRMGAGGDFAAAYVIAHEVAHHVQNQLGLLSSMRQTREDQNRQSVRIELMADCLSGVWARQAAQRFGSLEPGDVEEAINAAKEIGDDELQREAGQRVRPHTFTHGTSEQRQRWFATGYNNPQDIDACDTRQIDYARL